MKRILGLEWGEKRLGLALSDALLITAGPVGYLSRKKSLEEDLTELGRFIEENHVGEIVIGLPLHLDGGKGKSAESVEAFAGVVRERFDLPVHLWDERMSTKAVEKMLIEADLSRKKRRKVRDGLAAAYFLQGFLDARQRG
jgi:putative Holliday junction resolvase